MKRMFVYLILGAFVLSLSSPLLAVRDYTDKDVTDMIAKAPGKDQLPQAAAIVLLNQRVVKYNPDRSAVSDEHIVVKILQDRGKDTYGDIKQKYNQDSDSVVVVKAVTYLEDGTVMPVEAKAINDLTPADLANASIYSNVMQKVISFPGIAPGVTTELRLRIYSKAPEKKDELFIWGGDLFQSDDPISHKELSVIVPLNLSVRYTFQNEGLDHDSTTENGFTTYSWHIDNSPQIIEEPFMPRMIKIAPRLIYTNSTSWDQIGSWFSGKYYPHVKTGGEIDKKAKDLTDKAASTDDKIKSICLYVIKDIRGIGEWSLPLGLAGYEPHDADVVLANKYGDWRDKTVLLVSLLKAAGVESYPAFIHRDAPPLEKDYPSLKQFNAIYVYVPSYQGKPLWVNPFTDNSVFGYLPSGQGATSFVVKPTDSELLAVEDTPPDVNQSECRFELSVKPNGDVDGKIGCQLGGIFDYAARARLKDATPKEIDQYFLKTANAIGEGSKSNSFEKSDLKNLTEPVRIAQDFTTPQMGVVQGDMMIFDLPKVPFDFAGLPFYPGQAMRNYNFVFDTKMLFKKEGVINLPKGYKAVFVSDPVQIKNQFGNWESDYKLNADSTTVQYSSTITLTQKEIETGDYPQFKKAFDDFTSPRNSMILLEKR